MMYHITYIIRYPLNPSSQKYLSFVCNTTHTHTHTHTYKHKHPTEHLDFHGTVESNRHKSVQGNLRIPSMSYFARYIQNSDTHVTIRKSY